jgi:hypothetical protein
MPGRANDLKDLVHWKMFGAGPTAAFDVLGVPDSVTGGAPELPSGRC